VFSVDHWVDANELLLEKFRVHKLKKVMKRDFNKTYDVGQGIAQDVRHGLGRKVANRDFGEEGH
jgi:hypothetical protein